ncbi:hypothetical protein EC957_001833 [Mortierella hygrophila]|uniref:F-box domain-containing protein n=1 Tax=Mortierella hygrophila TaxID=979708 RepID=A0A9P6F476_9FUNG|nr:hypothetical protein EC957_001833 [Mortierella hygrophila]
MHTIKWKRSQNATSKQKKDSSSTTTPAVVLAPTSTTSSSSSSSSSAPSLFANTATSTAVATTTTAGAAATFPSNLFSHYRSTFTQHQQQPDNKVVQFSVALTIPEIILAIAAFLNRSTIAQCAVVCKDWHTIFQPLLFRIIKAADFDQPDFVTSFWDYTRFATSVEWFQEISPSPFASGAATGSKKQAWYRIFGKKASIRPLADPWKPFEQLKLILQANETPALDTLSVRIHNLDPNIVLGLRAPTVTTLQIGTRGYPARKPKVSMENILRSFPSLVHLTLEGLFTLSSQVADGSHPSYASDVVGGNESSSSSSSASQPQQQTQAMSTLPLLQAPVVTPYVTPAALAAPAHTTNIAGMTISGPFPVTPALPNISSSSSSSSSLSTNNGKYSSSPSTPNTAQTTSSIESLSLRLVDISQDHLLALARQMPRLSSLLIEEFLVPDMMIKIYRWTWSKQFIHSLRDSIPHLTSIRMAFPFDTIKEDTIIEILKGFPLLTTVGFRNSFFGTRALEVMQEHCKFVECLDVSFGNSRGFKGALIQFLQTWTRLREFEADGVVFSLDKPIDDGVPRSPWACTRLEKLVCGFSGTESMIFQHLSQLPLLTSLTISYPSISITPIETTLAWMAKSTRIEYFWFPQVRHVAVEKASVLWILEHWPELKTLHVAGGLVSQKEIVKQWCREAGRPNLVVEFDRV